MTIQYSKEHILEDLIGEMVIDSPHAEDLQEWREGEFKRLGFPLEMALYLASTNIDLHIMEDRLLNRGCSHADAVRLLIGTNVFGEDPTWEWSGSHNDDSDSDSDS